jgi:hypothetical protein
MFEEGESNPRALYPLVEQSFGKARWDDPAMDVYNGYDVYRGREREGRNAEPLSLSLEGGRRLAERGGKLANRCGSEQCNLVFL